MCIPQSTLAKPFTNIVIGDTFTHDLGQEFPHRECRSDMVWGAELYLL